MIVNGFGRFVACAVLISATAGCVGTAQDPEARYAEALAAFRRGDTDSALASAGNGSRQSRGVAPWSTRFDLLQAEIHLYKSGADDEVAQAQRLISGATDAARDDAKLRARWTYLRGYAAYKRHEYSQAVSILDEAVRLASDARAPEVEIDAYLRLNSVYKNLDRPDDAEKYTQKALRLAGEARDRYREAAALNNLGVTRLQAYRFDEAITFLDRARTLAAQAGADLLQESAVGNLSLCWREVGDLDRALEARLEALELQRRANIGSYVCQSLGELGNIRRERGEFPEAIASLREAVAMARSNKMSEEALWSADLAAALLSAGDTAEVSSWIAAARSGFQKVHDALELTGVELLEGDLAASRGDDAKAMRLYDAVVAAHPDAPEMIWQAQAGAANALRRSGQPSRARERFVAAVAAIDQGRGRLFRTDSKIGFLTEPIRVYQDYVALLLELGLEDDALAVVEASRARTLFEAGDRSRRQRPTVRAMVRAAREHDVVLLSYWISPRGSFAWVFRGDGARRVPLVDTDRLGGLLRAYRGVIEESLRDPIESGNEAARELYVRLVAPVRELLPENGRVIVVPDGPLHALNLETLIVDGARPHYLIEDFTIEVAPALAPLLVRASPTTEGAPAVLLVGDPEPSDPAFPRLPHAAQELDAIAVGLPLARIDRLTGAAATPAAVLSAPLDRYTFLHFAAHAQSSFTNPLSSSIVLSGDTVSGRLYAQDLVGTHLGARLVTLSACRSAGERTFSGEGMVGLAWVFMRAGALQVIAGLWDVSDRSTVVLMEGVYDRLGRGASPCNALRDAKLALMRASPTTSKPFHWAPFQIYTRTAAR